MWLAGSASKVEKIPQKILIKSCDWLSLHDKLSGKGQCCHSPGTFITHIGWLGIPGEERRCADRVEGSIRHFQLRFTVYGVSGTAVKCLRLHSVWGGGISSQLRGCELHPLQLLSTNFQRCQYFYQSFPSSAVLASRFLAWLKFLCVTWKWTGVNLAQAPRRWQHN